MEDPEDVAGIDEQALQELESARLEVLALVDDDRVVAAVGQVHVPNSHLSPAPPGSYRAAVLCVNARSGAAEAGAV
jgi:hypothetical protein